MKLAPGRKLETGDMKGSQRTDDGGQRSEGGVLTTNGHEFHEFTRNKKLQGFLTTKSPRAPRGAGGAKAEGRGRITEVGGRRTESGKPRDET